jgi:hypothetical protein
MESTSFSDLLRVLLGGGAVSRTWPLVATGSYDWKLMASPFPITKVNNACRSIVLLPTPHTAQKPRHRCDVIGTFTLVSTYIFPINHTCFVWLGFQGDICYGRVDMPVDVFSCVGAARKVQTDSEGELEKDEYSGDGGKCHRNDVCIYGGKKGR